MPHSRINDILPEFNQKIERIKNSLNIFSGGISNRLAQIELQRLESERSYLSSQLSKRKIPSAS
ncbi:MAG: hypothetical protein GF398_12230 [Chitinivibrionales bacterium]|nr:hypothetical protein [Chitinivibrionales bacterium]